MVYLIAVSALWAFSFGLIGSKLVGLDPVFVAAVRIGLAAVVFLPFARPGRLLPLQMLELTACGALQFGVMYLAYITAFGFIPSHLVALFSVFTPLYVTLFCGLGQRRIHLSFLGAAGLSVLGAAVIKAGGTLSGSLWTGFGLMQVAGLAFSGGQVWYRSFRRRHPKGTDRELMSWMYVGAFALAGSASALLSDRGMTGPDKAQWAVLVYLGVVASGIGFFLWNKGAAIARAATLAACNNAVVPLAMFTSLLFFGEAESLTGGQLVRLAIGTLLVGAAVFLGQRVGAGNPPREAENSHGTS